MSRAAARAAPIRAARIALVVAALAAWSNGLAHDFWIEPDTFHPPAGTLLALRLLVGQGFRGDPVPRNDSLIERFVLLDGRREIPARGREGEDPAGVVPIGGQGIQVVAYRSGPSRVELEAAKFEAYLADEGLEAIV